MRHPLSLNGTQHLKEKQAYIAANFQNNNFKPSAKEMQTYFLEIIWAEQQEHYGYETLGEMKQWGVLACSHLSKEEILSGPVSLKGLTIEYWYGAFNGSIGRSLAALQEKGVTLSGERFCQGVGDALNQHEQKNDDMPSLTDLFEDTAEAYLLVTDQTEKKRLQSALESILAKVKSASQAEQDELLDYMDQRLADLDDKFLIGIIQSQRIELINAYYRPGQPEQQTLSEKLKNATTTFFSWEEETLGIIKSQLKRSENSNDPLEKMQLVCMARVRGSRAVKGFGPERMGRLTRLNKTVEDARQLVMKDFFLKLAAAEENPDLYNAELQALADLFQEAKMNENMQATINASLKTIQSKAALTNNIRELWALAGNVVAAQTEFEQAATEADKLGDIDLAEAIRRNAQSYQYASLDKTSDPLSQEVCFNSFFQASTKGGRYHFEKTKQEIKLETARVAAQYTKIISKNSSTQFNPVKQYLLKGLELLNRIINSNSLTAFIQAQKNQNVVLKPMPIAANTCSTFADKPSCEPVVPTPTSIAVY